MVDNHKSDSLEFNFSIKPVPASRPRVTRWATFYPKTYTKFKKDMDVLVGNIKLDTIPYFEEGRLLSCKLCFYIPPPQTLNKVKLNKAAREKLIGEYCGNNADLDNYEKAILDSMNEYVYHDDKQIVKLSSVKYWGEVGKILVSISDAN